jgi:uncharacterized protein with NAD-binding domain and iron-sulfur cluster
VKQRVIIVGGGVAGLTAAHELVERDFEVHVYERRAYFGGKAASRRKPDPHSGDAGGDAVPPQGSDRRQVPGEHGFRFYPGWYRHIPDTMKRIPFKGKHRLYYEGATVFDNLVSADEELLAWYSRESMRVVGHPPHTFEQARIALTLVSRMRRLGLGPGEVTFFFGKLAEFLTTPEGKRVERFDQMTWWEYLDADKKSPAFQDLIAATSRTMVAAKAKQASAYTIANVAVRTLLDGLGTVDRMLNGPTNEVWIDPWIEHLRSRGVRFHLGQELDVIELDTTQKTIKNLKFSSTLAQNQQRLQWTLELVESWFAVVESLLIDPRTWYKKFKPYVGEPSSPDKDQVVKALLDTLSSAADGVARAARDIHPEAGLAEKLAVALGAWPPPVPPDTWQEEDAFYTAGEIETIGEIARLMKDAVANLRGLDDALREGRAIVEKIATEGAAALAPHLARWVDDELPAAIKELAEQVCNALKPLLPGSPERADLDNLLTRAVPDPATELADPKTTYFVFAVPVEQMAYYVNRAPMLTHYDPSLRRLILLSENTDWMVGIQFFLRETVEIVRGHLVCMDSEWSLTAVEHMQYWRDVELPSDVKSIISVDIAAWDQKGRFNRKEAFNCTAPEIAEEVWSQLTESINRDAKARVLRPEMLRYGELQEKTGLKRRSYHLDDSLVDLLDRRKQGSYEKARSVRFSADELLRRQRDTGHETDTPYVWGRRLDFNVEPLLINRAGTQALRPDSRTAIPNMFLAGDYVRTGTDLACMESANESARQAVNAILDASSSTAVPCKIWKLSASQRLLETAISAARIGEKAEGFKNGLLKAASGSVGRFAGDFLEARRRNDG